MFCDTISFNHNNYDKTKITDIELNMTLLTIITTTRLLVQLLLQQFSERIKQHIIRSWRSRRSSRPSFSPCWQLKIKKLFNQHWIYNRLKNKSLYLSEGNKNNSYLLPITFHYTHSGGRSCVSIYHILKVYFQWSMRKKWLSITIQYATTTLLVNDICW